VACYLPYFRQWLITCPLLALLPFQSLFTENSHGYQLLTPLPFSSALRALHPLCYVLLFSSLFIIQFFCWFFFFFAGQRSAFQGAMLVYPRGSCGNIVCRLFAHPLICVSHAGLEVASSGTGALFSQCNVAWISFVWAGGSGCWSFDSSWCFVLFCFLQVWLQLSVKSLIYGNHAVCFCPLDTALDPPPISACRHCMHPWS
jgi:hypothetical protein